MSKNAVGKKRALYIEPKKKKKRLECTSWRKPFTYEETFK
jgi:hypothetical protein